MTAKEDDATAAYLVEAGHLKRTKRAGWWIAGVRDPESVAEHSFRVGVIGYVLAVMEGADANRTAALCLFHDLPETRIGDIPSTGKRYITAADPNEIARDQTEGILPDVADSVRGLIGEFEANDSLEARCAKDADKLECLIQGLEYQAQGYQLAKPWVDTMVMAVRTDAGKRLAEAALRTPVDSWWHEIVASYGLPR
jgi:putative hydrolase of HD superfamily